MRYFINNELYLHMKNKQKTKKNNNNNNNTTARKQTKQITQQPQNNFTFR